MNKKEILKRIEIMINEINTIDLTSLQSSNIILGNVKVDLMNLKNKIDLYGLGGISLANYQTQRGDDE